MSRAERLPRCTATWRRRSSVARKRASMREGPLAELFRATEAAQRRERSDEHAEPAAATATPAPAQPAPDNPARLERARDTASYLAVIRVVGVGGAGLNALDRMMDAGITQVDFV